MPKYGYSEISHVNYQAQYQKMLNTYGSKSVALTMLVGDALARHAENKLTVHEAATVVTALATVGSADMYPAHAGQLASMRSVVDSFGDRFKAPTPPPSRFQEAVSKIWRCTADKSNAITAVVGVAAVMSETGHLTLQELDDVIKMIEDGNSDADGWTKIGSMAALKRLRLRYENPFANTKAIRDGLQNINVHLNSGAHAGAVDAGRVVFSLVTLVEHAGKNYTLSDIAVGLGRLGAGEAETIRAIKDCTVFKSLKDMMAIGKKKFNSQGIEPADYYDWELGIENNIQASENSLRSFAEHLFQGYMARRVA